MALTPASKGYEVVDVTDEETKSMKWRDIVAVTKGKFKHKFGRVTGFLDGGEVGVELPNGNKIYPKCENCVVLFEFDNHNKPPQERSQ